MSNVNTCLDLSCFDDIIGLSETSCECYPDNSYYNSKSCLYLDKAEGMNLRMIDALRDCATSDNIWLLMDDARDRAIKRFVAESQMKMAEKYDLARTTFNGYIGKNQVKRLRSLSRKYAGMRFRTAQVTGAYIEISQINTIFEATGSITLYVYNSLNDLLYTVSLDTQAGVMKSNTLATPMLLPLWDGRCDSLDYVFIYEYDSANQPYDNKLSCCGRNYIFDCARPYYSQRSNKIDGWASYLMAGNIETDSLDFSDLSCTAGDYTDGLQFNCKIYCDTTKQFCFEQQDINNPLYMATAFAILHASAQYLAISLITSDKINRYSMCNVEAMEAVRALHEKKYNEWLDRVIMNVDLKNTDCYICKSKFNLKRGVL